MFSQETDLQIEVGPFLANAVFLSDLGLAASMDASVGYSVDNKLAPASAVAAPITEPNRLRGRVIRAFDIVTETSRLAAGCRHAGPCIIRKVNCNVDYRLARAWTYRGLHCQQDCE
jgi:hypothetical protein